MTKFNIHIISDTICSWCYVGHKCLQTAIKIHHCDHLLDSFNITYSPYYLNPSAPKVSIDKRTYYFSKFGESCAKGIFEHLSVIGHEVGINFKFSGKTRNM